MTSASGGSAAKATSERRQSRYSMKPTIPPSIRMSATAMIAPEAKSSPRESASLVTRVTIFPTGVRSK